MIKTTISYLSSSLSSFSFSIIASCLLFLLLSSRLNDGRSLLTLGCVGGFLNTDASRSNSFNPEVDLLFFELILSIDRALPEVAKFINISKYYFYKLWRISIHHEYACQFQLNHRCLFGLPGLYSLMLSLIKRL